jgi:hypothetical protein
MKKSTNIKVEGWGSMGKGGMRKKGEGEEVKDKGCFWYARLGFRVFLACPIGLWGISEMLGL